MKRLLVTPLRDDEDALSFIERTFGVLVPGSHLERHGANYLRIGDGYVVLTSDPEVLLRSVAAAILRGRLCSSLRSVSADELKQLGAPVITLRKLPVRSNR